MRDDDDDDENGGGRANAGAGNAATYPGMRWGILALACAVMFGNYYAYDLIASIAVPLQAHFDLNDAEWSYWVQALYSIYSVPNLVLPLVVGAVNDQVGTRTVLLVLSLLIVMGQALVAIGVTVKSMILAMLGRLVFGIGGESLSVAQTRLTAKWFKGKEMAFALGVNLSVARLGSVANDIVSPWIAVSLRSVNVAAWAGLLCCLLSLLCAVGVSVVDQRHWAGDDGGEDFFGTAKPVLNRTGYERVPEIEMAAAGPRALTDARRGDAGSAPDDGDGSAFRNRDIHVADSSRGDLQLNANFQLGNHSSDEEDIKVASPADSRPRDRIRKGGQSDATLTMLDDSPATGRARRQSSPARGPLLSIARQDGGRGGVLRPAVGSPPLLVLCFLMFALYGTVIPFNTIHSAFLQSRWYPGDPEKAARVMAIPDTISALFVAPCGTFVDRVGHRMRILLSTSLGIAAVHVVLGTATRESLPTPVVPLVVLGFCYANLLTYWACVPLLVHESQVAQAYGMATVSLNLSSVVFPLVVGTLQVADPTFRLVEMFFVGCGIVGALCCLVLRWLDPDGILDMPEARAVKVAVARWH